MKSGRNIDPKVEELVDYLFERQAPDGGWPYPVEPFLLPFLERDDYYIAEQGALLAGYLPNHFKQSGKREQIDRLIGYLQAHYPESLHHRIVLLRASARLSGLLTERQHSEISKSIRGTQNADGGWTLARMGTWPRYDGPENDPNGPSDGYATALAALALCETGTTRGPAIARALTWLDGNQRVSGRWYTRSLYSKHFKNYLSNMATSYAIMAFAACEKDVNSKFPL